MATLHFYKFTAETAYCYLLLFCPKVLEVFSSVLLIIAMFVLKLGKKEFLNYTYNSYFLFDWVWGFQQHELNYYEL